MSPFAPNRTPVKLPSELRETYQTPFDGRKTAKSVMPS
jgi:hypothetical protein